MPHPLPLPSAAPRPAAPQPATAPAPAPAGPPSGPGAAERYDDTGKVSFDHVYDQPDPRAYHAALRPLGYRIPQAAQPYFQALLAEYRTATGAGPAAVRQLTVLDVGCSYGVNAALLRCDLTLEEVASRYAAAAEAPRQQLVAADRALATERARPHPPHVIGLDSSGPALGYALDAGWIDAAVHADLESGDPAPEHRRTLADVDVVVSTGCIGYVTAATLRRVADAATRPPWMAHFCLRSIDYAEVATALDPLGYVTAAVGEPVRQRRFADAAERDLVLAGLAARGIDTTDHEDDGWFYAQLYVSRPHARKADPS